MNFHYHETSTGANLCVSSQDQGFIRQVYAGQNHPYLTIAWNRGEEQRVWVDEMPYQLGHGQVLLMIYEHSFRFAKPADITAWQFDRNFYCILDHDAEVGCAGILFYGLPSPMTLTLSSTDNRRLDLLYQVFVDEFATHDNIQGEMLRMLLKRLIIILTRLAKEQHLQHPAQQDEVDIVRQYNLLVEKHFSTLHQVQDYANLLHKSPKTLAHLFRKYSDKTPRQHLRERIAIEAKRLLIYTEKTVAEIGYEIGFQESAHFNRFFKQQVGMAPGRFRQNNRSNHLDK
ncbi:MAG: helix-turn-helix domain-containing protein [Bacteroidota bacterium]